MTAPPLLRGVLVGAALALAGLVRAQGLLDDFRDARRWQASASDQVQARVERDRRGDGLCLHYDFGGVSGYAVMRRELPIDWPAHYEIRTVMHGTGGANDVQIKFVDASGDNVWWVRRPDVVLPARPTPWRFRPRHVEFAWGPATDRTLRQTRHVEFVVASGRDGGRGRLCVQRLLLEPRAADPAVWPEPVVRTRAGVTTVDFRALRELSGLALQWPASAGSAQRRFGYRVGTSTDGVRYAALRTVQGSDGGYDAIHAPELEARAVRIHHPGRDAPRVRLVPPQEWPTTNALLSALAREAPRGDLPRAFLGEQSYWTLVGVDGGAEKSALIDEDGAIEWGRGGPSLAPAIRRADGRRITWAQAQVSQSLRDGDLPLPAVHWRHEDLQFDIEAAADGPRGAPRLLARYTLRNIGREVQDVVLELALRPWQVNPPQQFLATPGGASPIAALRWEDGALGVDGRGALRATVLPSEVRAQRYDGGASLASLAAAPALNRLQDRQRLASALLRWRITLPPGASRSVGVALPLAGQPLAAIDAAALASAVDGSAAAWRERLGRVTLQLPADAQPLAQTLRTSLAHLLMSREGPALRPGTRSYGRSWIRDGAMMVAALVRLGEFDAAREFVDWYAGHLYASGKVPCCVSARGADPVVENDSHGQYLYAVAELLRFGADAAFAARHWPHVQRVVAWMEAQRQSERTARNREPGREHLYGLMPPSISHEGYSDKAAYSYWDDFWTLRGYKDAVFVAGRMGDDAQARRWAAWRDEFAAELTASIEATARVHRIDHIAGAADRGDFDATSTTIALSPVQAAVPSALLRATFERYWRESAARAEGTRPWRDYTPYELRAVGALVRLGQPERAHAMLDFFFRHQRPAAWRQWAEVVLPDAREVRFLGDMPHAWVSSDYLRSVLELLAMEVEPDRLVIGAGWRAAWLAEPVLGVQGLRTPQGRLDYRLERQPAGWRLDVPVPIAGTVVLRWPDGVPLPRARAAGQPLDWRQRDLVLPATPIRIDLDAP